MIDRAWPGLPYARPAVLLGAATHDIGKVLCPAEIQGPGGAHETAGEALLLAHGFRADEARFARTHGHWQGDSPSPPPALRHHTTSRRVTHFTHWKPRRSGATNRSGKPCPCASGTPPTWVASIAPRASSSGSALA